jgi:membrane-associated phospholipid phosphatase
LWFEPNALAALPSIHVAATVLLLLAVRRISVQAGVLAGVYALLMTFAVVYLGEHYLIDALAGWVVAGVGWWAAVRLTIGRDR